MEQEDIYASIASEIAKERGVDPNTLPSAQKKKQIQEELDGNPVGDFLSESLQGAAHYGVSAWQSIGAGMADAALETKDFLVGEPEEADKSEFRKGLEAKSESLRSQNIGNSLIASVSQFATGMVGAGKLTAPIKTVQKLKNAGKAGRLTYETARGAAVGAVVIDPHEERLSNLIQEYEVLQNPVTEFLAAKDDDSDAMGRFKNALEGIGMDLAIAGTFAVSLKALKAMRGGDEATVQQLSEQLSKEVSQAITTKADETITPKVEPDGPPESVDPKSLFEEVQIDDISKTPSEATAIPAKKVDPGYNQKVEVTEATSEEVIASARQDFDAITKYGSRDLALANGHQFTKANLPWQKLNTTDEVQVLVENTAKSIKSQFDAAKGGSVLSDYRVKAMVKETADLFGEDPEMVMGTLTRQGQNATSMVADMEASYIITRKMFEETANLATSIKNGIIPSEFGGDITKAQQHLVKMHSAAADMMAAGSSIRAAAGRSLRRNRREFAITTEDIQNFQKIDPERLTEILASTKGDLKKLRDTVNPGWRRKVIDHATFLLTNNLLWNWTTHAVNTTTNFYMLAARPAEKLIGSYAMGTRGSSVRKQALKEYYYTLTALSDGWAGMYDAFMKGDSILSPHTDEYFQSGSRVNVPEIGWKPVKDTWDLFENGVKAANYRQIAEASKSATSGAYRVGVGVPTRALGGIDEFVKTLRYRSIVQARAAVEASEMGLKGKDFSDHIQKSIEDALDVDGRALDNQALQEAQISTFQQDLLPDTLGKAVQNFRHNYPAVALILPFVKTPVNVLRYGWKMTPGLNLLQTEYRQMVGGSMGSEAQAQAIGQMTLGTTFMGLAASLALSGRITGGGPSDYKVQKQLMATGWQPYSLVIENDEGEKTYFPLGRFDPVAMPFGMVADLVDMMSTNPGSKDAEKGLGAVALSLAKAMGEKTFLQNVNQFVRAASEPGTYGGKFIGGLAGNLIPGSSGIKAYANSDPYLREARTFMDHMMKGMPMYSETLPPQRDAFGDPMWRKRGLTTTSDFDVVEEEHARIIMESGHGISPPTPSAKGGVDLRDVTLKDGRNAYDLYQEYTGYPPGQKPLKQALAEVIKSPQYQQLVDGDPEVKGVKLRVLKDIVSKYRSAALKRLTKENPELRNEFLKRQIDVKAAVDAKRQKPAPRGEDLRSRLEAMGY